MRIAILALLALATVACLFLAFHRQPVPVGALFLAGISLLVGVIVAFVHLRHAGFAALMALAPLPGMIAVGPFAIRHGLTLSGLLAIYGFAYLLAACLAGELVRAILDERARVDALRQMLSRLAAPAGLGIALGAALLMGWLFRDAGGLGLAACVELVAAGVSVFAWVTAAGSLLPFGEGFFVEANRARERRERWLRLATRITEPRWGLSLTGIGLVFAVLGGFGAAPLLGRSALLAQPALWAASALLVFLVAFAFGRDWRGAFSVLLTTAALALASLWLWGRASGHLSVTSFVEIAVTAAQALFVMLWLLARSGRHARAGDEAAVAQLQAIEELGVAPYFGALGAAAAIAPWIVLHGSIATLALLNLLAGAAALWVSPAIVTALHALVPRRRSLNALYGRN